MQLINQTSNSVVTLTYQKNTAIVKVDGKHLTSFDACVLFDFLKANMSTRSKSPGVKRRAKVLKHHDFSVKPKT